MQTKSYCKINGKDKNLGFVIKNLIGKDFDINDLNRREQDFDNDINFDLYKILLDKLKNKDFKYENYQNKLNNIFTNKEEGQKKIEEIYNSVINNNQDDIYKSRKIYNKIAENLKEKKNKQLLSYDEFLNYDDLLGNGHKVKDTILRIQQKKDKTKDECKKEIKGKWKEKIKNIYPNLYNLSFNNNIKPGINK